MTKQVRIYDSLFVYILTAPFLEVTKAHEWLKIFTEPWCEVTSNWRICYSKRRDDIIHAVDGNNIIDVLNNWKLFSHSLGCTLVSISNIF